MKKVKVDAYWLVPPRWTAGNKPNIIVVTSDCCLVVNGVDYWIPAGYECDGASIPRLFWAVPGIGAPHSGYNAWGAIAHDVLYLTHALPRWMADEVAFQLWHSKGKPLAACRVMWAAVRSPIGAMAWSNGQEDLECLSLTRRLIGYRDPEDKKKFDALWFAKAA